MSKLTFLDGVKVILILRLHFYILCQVNLFYDMQSKFQNKVVFPKETYEVHFITSLNIFSLALP
jgi:hypothetical protein